MRIAILSDIHDHLWNLTAALEHISGAADVLLCCGDLCSPFVIDLLKRFSGPVHIVFGNNDADLFRITRKSGGNVQLHGEFAELDLDGKRIAMQHFDYIARPIAASGQYDVVCFGHNHRFSIEWTDRRLAINPGAIMGAAFPPEGWEEVPPTFVIYDTAAHRPDAFRIDVAGGRRVGRFEVA